MKQFISTTACARAHQPGSVRIARQFAVARRASIIGVGCILSLLAAPLAAQRVEIPTPVQPVQSTSPYSVAPSPYAVPTPSPYVVPANPSPYAVSPAPTPTYGAPAPAPTYAAPTYAAPPPAPPAYSPYPTAPASPPPTYSPAAIGPPPAFDPYASGGSIAPAAPVAAPYGYTPQPAVPYGQQPAPLVPGPPPYQAAPYDITTSGEGYWAKTQRLLQEISFEYTYLYGKHSNPNDFSLNEAEISATFAFPIFGNIETPLLVTPGFETDWLQGPLSGPPIVGPPVMAGGPDLPPRLYAAYLDFAWFPHCYEWLGGELGVPPGIWSDFHNVDSDSIRILGPRR